MSSGVLQRIIALPQIWLCGRPPGFYELPGNFFCPPIAAPPTAAYGRDPAPLLLAAGAEAPTS